MTKEQIFEELVNLNPNISFLRSWTDNSISVSAPIEQMKLPQGFYNIAGKISNGKNDVEGGIEFPIVVEPIKEVDMTSNHKNDPQEAEKVFWELVNLNPNISFLRSWTDNSISVSAPIEQMKLPQGFYNIAGKISNRKKGVEGGIEFPIVVEPIKEVDMTSNYKNDPQEAEKVFWELVNLNPNISFLRSWTDNSISVSAPIEQMKLPQGFYNVAGKISNRKNGVEGGIEFPIVVEPIKEVDMTSNHKNDPQEAEKVFWELVNLNPNISFLRSWTDDSISVSAPIEQMKLPQGFYNVAGKISNRKNGVEGGIEFPIVVEPIKEVDMTSNHKNDPQEAEKVFWELVNLNPNISFLRSWTDNSISVSAPIEQMKLPQGFYNVAGKISNRKNGVEGGIEFTIIPQKKIEKKQELSEIFNDNDDTFKIQKVENPNESTIQIVKEAIIRAMMKLKNKIAGREIIENAKSR